MKVEIKIEDLEVGQELNENQNWLNKREQDYRNKGFYKKGNGYVIYENTKHVITEKRSSAVRVFCEKKTNKGTDCYSWFSEREINDRF